MVDGPIPIVEYIEVGADAADGYGRIAVREGGDGVGGGVYADGGVGSPADTMTVGGDGGLVQVTGGTGGAGSAAQVVSRPCFEGTGLEPVCSSMKQPVP